MYAQLAFEAATIAGGAHDPLIGTSPDQVPPPVRLASVVFFVAAVLSLGALVFGLWVLTDQSRVKRTGSEPWISPNTDGRLIVAASVVGLLISLPVTVLLPSLTS